MLGKPQIRLCDQGPVEALLAHARFVACYKDDSLSFGIEGEGRSPFAIAALEPQFLHIGVFRSLERVGVRPAKLGTVIGQQPGGGDQHDADITLKSQNLALKSWVELDLLFI